MAKDTKLSAEKEAERQRFLDFIGLKPDLTEISEKSGILRQTLYYISKGTTLPTVDIHRDMAKAYPDYDLNWQILGVRSEEVSQSLIQKPVENEVTVLKLKEELSRLFTENEFLKRELDRIETDKTNYWKLLERIYDQNRT